MTRLALLAVLFSAWLSSACTPVYWLGMRLHYDKVNVPSDRITMNIGYDASDPTDHKRQLDFYAPDRHDFPTVVFIHGGGWAWGDRSQKFGGADVYGNIGRFLAREGFGAAVISYRLIWKTDWRTQATDVARAVAWVQQNVAVHGGDPRRVFLAGHSAGAQLAARVATDPQWLTRVNGEPHAICGVVAVSGTGFDFEDRLTEQLDQDTTYYSQRFGGSSKEDPNDLTTSAWRKDASILPVLDATDPPMLSMLAEGDYPSIQHQVRLLDERLKRLGLSGGFVIVPKINHERIVLELSRGDHIAGPAMLKFLRETRCPR
jgi:acetyl esterase/lipase